MTKPRIITPFDPDYVAQIKMPAKAPSNGGKGWATQQKLRLSREDRILRDRHGGVYSRARKAGEE